MGGFQISEKGVVSSPTVDKNIFKYNKNFHSDNTEIAALKYMKLFVFLYRCPLRG